MGFLDQLALVHLGRWCHPQLDGDVACTTQQLGGRAEVADVGHTAADEGFVDLGAGDVGQELGVVRVVGAAQDRLFDLVHVDLDGIQALSCVPEPVSYPLVERPMTGSMWEKSAEAVSESLRSERMVLWARSLNIKLAKDSCRP